MLNAMERMGGAAIATQRLHRAMRRQGIDSRLLVQARASTDASVIGPRTTLQRAWSSMRAVADQWAVRGRADDRGLFSPALVPRNVRAVARSLDATLVHAFWVTDGFLRPEDLAGLGRPLVWTLHDMWPFTGGCHYDAECGRYRESCGRCPVLASGQDRDLSRRVFERKREAWKGIDLTVVATSRWIGRCARESALFRDRRIECIPNCVDMSVYKPVDRRQARELFNLPQHRPLVLVSAMNATSDPRKGFALLEAALLRVAAARPHAVDVVVLGADQGSDVAGLKTHYLGSLQDEVSQVMLYGAADVLVAPSLQENLANTVVEALACGCPVAAFDIGGMPDMITHLENGVLAAPRDPTSLADGILWVLEDARRRDRLGAAARESAMRHFSEDAIVGAYAALYSELAR